MRNILTVLLKSIFIFITLQNSSTLFCQNDTIYFVNPSFVPVKDLEAKFICNDYKGYLKNCSFEKYGCPKIGHTGFKDSFFPAEGSTYIALFTSNQNYWQSVSQRITKSFRKGMCYSFKLALATNEKFLIDSSPFQDSYIDNLQPVVLRIYAGKNRCDKGQLIGYTDLVINQDWQDYVFSFEALDYYNSITFEVYFQVATINHYDGVLFLDHLSPIVPIPCWKANKIDQSLVERFDAQRKLRLSEIREQSNIYHERINAAEAILNEKIEELVTQGLFEKESKEIKSDAKELINEIIELLKANRALGIDVGIKKVGSKSLRKWRREYLIDTLILSGVNQWQFDVDKISKFIDTNWEFENDLFAIEIFKTY